MSASAAEFLADLHVLLDGEEIEAGLDRGLGGGDPPGRAITTTRQPRTTAIRTFPLVMRFTSFQIQDGEC